MPEAKTSASNFPSFDKFVNTKKPIMAILYIALLAIGYLYIDLRSSFNKRDKERIETISDLNRKVNNLYGEVGFLNDRVRRADSSMADMAATLRVLKQVGRIPQ
jgi:hypothetical protein